MSCKYDGDSLDFRHIEKELHKAVESDEKYWRENDAKFRAVNQKVGSYEEFRDIVKAAHIKPLEKEDKGLTAAPAPWNAIAEKERGDVHESNTSKLMQNSVTVPKNSQEFMRDWKRYYKTADEQYSFLLKLGGVELGRIFKTDVSCLGEILLALQEFKADDSFDVLCILQNLSTANRFSLSVQFLSSKEKNACCSIFKKLEEIHNVAVTDNSNPSSETELNLSELKSKYSVNK